MSCKSALYGANTSAQNVANGGVINFGNVVRRFGNNCNMSNGNAVVTGCGYYDLDTDVTFTTGTTGGTAVITLYKDGVAIPGAVASVTAEAGTTYQISIPAIVRQMCCNTSILTAVLTGISASVINAAIAVEKI